MRRKNLGRLLPPRKKKDKGLQDVSISFTDAVQTVVASEVPVPHKFGFIASAVTFADSVEPEAVDVFLKCELSPTIFGYLQWLIGLKLVSYIAKQVLFPLESCILFEGRAESWIAPLEFDPAFLHCMIFSAQFYFDAITSRQIPGVTPHLTPRTLPYYKKTLDLLQKRFLKQDIHTQTSYTTFSIVNILACHAYVTGDHASAKHYVECLHRLITLRGGTSSFDNSPKLLAEIIKYGPLFLLILLLLRVAETNWHRSDISITLASGPTPTFSNSQEPNLPYPDLALLVAGRDLTETDPIPLINMNNELAQVWKRMSEFCSVINLAADSGQLITTQVFLQSMASIVYPLLSMQFQTSSSNEAIRLCLLAFSSSVFLPWRQLGLPYPHLRSQLKTCLLQLDPWKAPPALHTWLLMISAVSVLDSTDECWLQPLLLVNIKRSDNHSWSAMRNLLKSFLWIGLVHDRPGRSIFDSTVRYEEVHPVVSSMSLVDVSEIINSWSDAIH
jgi:hypothetical protein